MTPGAAKRASEKRLLLILEETYTQAMHFAKNEAKDRATLKTLERCCEKMSYISGELSKRYKKRKEEAKEL